MAIGWMSSISMFVLLGHDHLPPLGQLDRAGHVRRPEVELGPVAVEARRAAAALVLREDVHLGSCTACAG